MFHSGDEEETSNNPSNALFLGVVGVVLPCLVSVPVRSFIYVDKCWQPGATEAGLQLEQRSADTADIELDTDTETAEVARAEDSRARRISRVVRRALRTRTRRPPTNFYTNRGHQQAPVLGPRPSRAYSLYDLRDLAAAAGSAAAEVEEAAGLPPSYSAAVGLDQLPPSYSDTAVTRLRLGPYVVLLENRQIHAFRK